MPSTGLGDTALSSLPCRISTSAFSYSVLNFPGVTAQVFLGMQMRLYRSVFFIIRRVGKDFGLFAVGVGETEQSVSWRQSFPSENIFCGLFRTTGAFFLIFVKAFLKLQGRRRVEPLEQLDLVLGVLLIEQ